MADTGCESCLMDFNACRDLLPVALEIWAANRNSIKVLGAAILLIRGSSKTRDLKETQQLVYVTNTTNQFFLSKGACIESFHQTSRPLLGSIMKQHHFDFTTSTSAYLNRQSLDEDLPRPGQVICECSKREPSPELPKDLPYLPTEENRIKLQDYLLQHYKTSAFSTCEHQPLPMMIGPPLALQIQESAEPIAHHTPISVPLAS